MPDPCPPASCLSFADVAEIVSLSQTNEAVARNVEFACGAPERIKNRSYCPPSKMTAEIPRILSEKGMRHREGHFAFRHFYKKTITRSFGANRKLHVSFGNIDYAKVV